MPATICDHVEPHRGDVNKFWLGPFMSLCKR
jgi:5-methylcytosine-specific restriction enzyme A